MFFPHLSLFSKTCFARDEPTIRMLSIVYSAKLKKYDIYSKDKIDKNGLYK